jgi:hypothetical protein
MLDVIIYLKCSGPNVRADNFTDTIQSVIKNIGIQEYSFYIVVEPGFLTNAFNIIKECGIQDKLYTIIASENSWAYDYNLFLSSVELETKWIGLLIFL